MSLEDLRIGAPLGRGGSGQVYAAQHRDSGHALALKILSLGDPERQMDEVRALARLRHPGLVAVYDTGVLTKQQAQVIGHPAGNRWIVMERATGGQLQQSDASQLVLRALLQALRHAHARGVLHLDIKPSNVLWRSPEKREVLLVDFGISHVEGRWRAAHGTPGFMAPEQRSDLGVGPQTDLYALGRLAQWLGLSGPWVERMVQADPSARPASANEALGLLEALQLQKVSPEQIQPMPTLTSQEEGVRTGQWGPRAEAWGSPRGTHIGALPLPHLEKALRSRRHIATQPSVHALGEPPLLERYELLQTLWSALRTQAGRQIHRLQGPSGVGRSRLMTAFCEAVAETDAAQVWMPKRPADLDAILQQAAGSWRRVPWIARRFERRLAQALLRPADQVQSLSRLLEASAPVLLGVEDLSACPILLAALTRIDPSCPVMVLDLGQAPLPLPNQRHQIPPLSDASIRFLLLQQGATEGIALSQAVQAAQGRPAWALDPERRRTPPVQGHTVPSLDQSIQLLAESITPQFPSNIKVLEESEGVEQRVLAEVMRARLMGIQGDNEGRLQAMARAESLLERLEAPDPRLAVVVAMNRAHTLQWTDIHAAISQMTALLEAVPQDAPTLRAELWMRLGDAYSDRHQWAQANSAWRASLSLNPPPGLRRRLLMLQALRLADELHDYPGATAALDEVEAQALAAGDWVRAARCAGKQIHMRIRMKQAQRAEEAAQRALLYFGAAQDSTGAASTCISLGDLHRNRGENEHAKAAYRRAHELLPESHPEAYVVAINLQLLDLVQGKPIALAESLASLEHARSALPALVPYALLICGIAALQVNRSASHYWQELTPELCKQLHAADGDFRLLVSIAESLDPGVRARLALSP